MSYLQSHTISQRKSLKLKGTKTSVTKNQILISTGIVSLDTVLGKEIQYEQNSTLTFELR